MTAGQGTIKSMTIGVLGTLGIEERARYLYWRARLWRTRCSVEHCGVTRQFWAIDQQIQSRVYGASEREQLHGFLRSIRAGDAVWDVGAFVGLYALFAAHFAGPTGCVAAFEPDRVAFRRLRRNCRLNAVENVRPMRLALSDRAGTADLFVSRKHVGQLTPSAGRERRQKIRLARGDDLVASAALPAPNVLKIDVEGAEYLVLQGLRDSLSQPACRYLLLEVHPPFLPQFGCSVDDIRGLLRECGFAIEREQQRGKELHWVACK